MKVKFKINWCSLHTVAHWLTELLLALLQVSMSQRNADWYSLYVHTVACWLTELLLALLPHIHVHVHVYQGSMSQRNALYWEGDTLAQDNSSLVKPTSLIISRALGGSKANYLLFSTTNLRDTCCKGLLCFLCCSSFHKFQCFSFANVFLFLHYINWVEWCKFKWFLSVRCSNSLWRLSPLDILSSQVSHTHVQLFLSLPF